MCGPGTSTGRVRLRSRQIGLVDSVMILVDGSINADTGFVDAAFF
jgi:hypothetical protein